MTQDDPKKQDAMNPEPTDPKADDLDEPVEGEVAVAPRQATRAARGPTLDETEQGLRSLELLDQLVDDSADAEIERDGPVEPAGLRLTAFAHRTLDDLERRLSDGRPVVVEASDVPGHRAAFDGQEDAVPLAHTPDKLDTGRIRRLERPQLVRLVERLSTIRGESPPSCEGLSKEQLEDMARRLRASAHA